MKFKEEPNWVVKYNHFSEVDQKKEQAKRIIKELSSVRSRKNRGQDKPNQI